jgi:PAS domain-containing protein
MTLQRFLARLTWLSLAPVVLAAVLLAGLDLLGHQRDADFVAEGRAKALAAALDAELRARIQGLGLLAQSPALDDPNDRAALRQTLRTWRELYDSQAMLTDDAGQVLAHAAPAPGGSAPELPEVIDESLRRAVIESGIPALSGVYRERVTHEDKVAVLVPLLRTGKPALLLIATVDTRTLREAVPAASLPQGWSARLLDRDGRAVGTVGAAGAPAGTTPRAWAPLPAAGWRLELWAPAVAAKPVVAREAGIFALGLVLALLVAWWVARRASQRLLRQLAGLLQTGPAADHPPDPAPIAEILALRRQLDEAAQTRESAQAGRRTTEQNYRASLESANRALRLSEGRLKAIVESAGDAILILDARSRNWSARR